MNREIKLRLWNPNAKVLTGGTDLNTILITTDGEFVKEFNQCDMVWMQFTGLKDKNGVDIYEGDICSTYNIDEPSNLVDTVVFDDGSFVFQNDYKLSAELRGFKTDYIEVIGNIYQTPELLESVQK